MNIKNGHFFFDAKSPRRRVELISLFVGIFLFLTGLLSLPFSHFLGLNLTVGHCLIITFAGGFLAWNGRIHNARRCFYACLFFGLFFLTHGVAGSLVDFFIGVNAKNPFENGSLGGMLPDYFNLERNDHILNFILAGMLLGEAIDWWSHYRAKPG